MNLSSALKLFFHENDFQKLSDRISIIRYDGITVYSNVRDDFESATTSALVSGLWQAAKSLNSMVKTNNEFIDFKLSFDSSENGLFILPFLLDKKEYYLCTIYKDVVNPAKLKRDMRIIKENLEVYLEDFSFAPTSSKQAGREGFLFKDITDEEIDRLFDYGEAR